MRQEKMLVPKFAYLRAEDVLQIISLNVQSIRKHRAAIEADPVIQASCVLNCQEMWAKTGESYPCEISQKH